MRTRQPSPPRRRPPSSRPAGRDKPVPAIEIRLVGGLRAHRGELRSGQEKGTEVHAGSFLRRREIVLDSALLARPPEMLRILTHELYHFVWLRLGNAARRSYEDLVAGECRGGMRGELGWSSQWRKDALSLRDRTQRTRRWREYVCESFCDTASWLIGGTGRHPEYTLERPARERRRAWFLSRKELERISV